MRPHLGQLNQLVSFEQQSSAATSFDVQTWQPFAQAWARIWPAKSSEPVLADQVQQVLTHTVTVLLVPELAVALDAAQWRIVYTDRFTGIQHVLGVVGPGRAFDSMYLSFSCSEGLADGH